MFTFNLVPTGFTTEGVNLRGRTLTAIAYDSGLELCDNI